MILVCSSCRASYLVPATAFASGPRRVRCARCSHIWQADLPSEITAVLSAMSGSEEAAPAAPSVHAGQATEATPSPEAVQRVLPPISPGSNLPVLRKDSRRAKMRRAGPAAAAVFLFAGILALVWHTPADGIPWLRWDSVLRTAGLVKPRKGEGFSLQKVRSERRFEDGGMKLAVEGEIRNDNREARAVPDILLVAIGSDGSKIQSWRIGAPVAKLAAGASTPFRFSAVSPEQTVAEVNLSVFTTSLTESSSNEP